MTLQPEVATMITSIGGNKFTVLKKYILLYTSQFLVNTKIYGIIHFGIYFFFYFKYFSVLF